MANDRSQARRRNARLASEALTNLTIFNAIVSILEGGNIFGDRARSVATGMISTCKTAIQAELRAMDAAMDKVTHGE